MPGGRGRRCAVRRRHGRGRRGRYRNGCSGALRRCPGVGLPGVHLLRTIDDAIALRADLHKAVETGQTVAIVGGGFIGSEVAATARQLGCQVTLFVPDDVPLRAALGPYADAVADLHAANGVIDPSLCPGPGRPSVRRRRARGASRRRRPGSRRHGGAGHRRGARGRLAGRFRTGTERWAVAERRSAAMPPARPTSPASTPSATAPPGTMPSLGYHYQIEHWTSAKERGAVVAARLLGAEKLPTCRPPYVWSDIYGKTPPAGRLPRPGRSSRHPRAHARSRLDSPRAASPPSTGAAANLSPSSPSTSPASSPQSAVAS